jgi:hypothetical protein
MKNDTPRQGNNLIAHGKAILCAAEKSRFAFSFFSFSAANGAGDAMV